MARWLVLTRSVLPGMAAAQGWPIRLDHCFMRVFLDHACGRRWDEVAARPATRHMPLRLLEQAIDLAERVVREPGLLPGLDAQSLSWRGVQRRGRTGG